MPTQSARPQKKVRVENTSEENLKGSHAQFQSKKKVHAIPLKTLSPSLPSSAKSKGKQKAEPQEKLQNPEAESARDLSRAFTIVAGSYEKLLYGLDASLAPSSSTCESTPSYDVVLKPVFAFPAHVSCVKAVAASSGRKWLATGAADEIIKLWDLRRRKELGGLMHHQGSITQLYFPSRAHLISASEDGTLALFRARDWTLLRSLKGHTGRVNALAVHPSGKLALSVGKDRTLRLWDLMRGRGAASTKLGKEGELVKWSITGQSFIVQYQSTIDLFTSDMVLRHSIKHPSRIHSVLFCKHPSTDVNGEILLVGAEDKKVGVYFVPEDPDISPCIVAECVGHENRVKAVGTIRVALPQSMPSPTNTPSTLLACTVSSDGKIRVFDLADVPSAFNSSKPTSIIIINAKAEYDTRGLRLTCLTVASCNSISDITEKDREANANGKRARDDDEVSDESEDDDDGWEDTPDGDGEEEEEEGEEEAEEEEEEEDE